jgi:hypothetical protein
MNSDEVLDTSVVPTVTQRGMVYSVEDTTPTVEPEETPVVETTPAPVSPPASLPADEEWNYVPLNDAQQRRFNRLYRQVKTMQAAEVQFVEDNRKLIQRLNELQKELHSLKADKQFEDLEIMKRTALEAQDLQAYDRVQTELMNRRLAAAAEPGPEPFPEPDTPALPTPQEQIIMDVADWVNEVDATGQKVRPWASDESHPLHAQAHAISQEVINKYGNSTAVSHFDMMEMIDRRVAAIAARQKKLSTPVIPAIPVLSGHDTPVDAPTKGAGRKLTDAQKVVAVKLFPGSKTPYKDYAEALDALGQ